MSTDYMKLEHEDIRKKYLDYSYADLLNEFCIPPRDRWEYSRVSTEELMQALDIPWNYDSDNYEVPFLYEFQTPVSWICTDTLVGVFFLFLEDETTGGLSFIGTREQVARKSDSSFSFFNEEVRENLAQRMLKLIRPNPGNYSFIIDVNDKIFN